MRNKTKLWSCGILVLSGLALALAAAEGPEGPPVITGSFASPELRPGDTWKIYLNAIPDGGRMTRIAAMVEQPGMGTYPAAGLRVPRESGEEISDYIGLNTHRLALQFL